MPPRAVGPACSNAPDRPRAVATVAVCSSEPCLPRQAAAATAACSSERCLPRQAPAATAAPIAARPGRIAPRIRAARPQRIRRLGCASGRRRPSPLARGGVVSHLPFKSGRLRRRKGSARTHAQPTAPRPPGVGCTQSAREPRSAWALERQRPEHGPPCRLRRKASEQQQPRQRGDPARQHRHLTGPCRLNSAACEPARLRGRTDAWNVTIRCPVSSIRFTRRAMTAMRTISATP